MWPVLITCRLRLNTCLFTQVLFLTLIGIKGGRKKEKKANNHSWVGIFITTEKELK